MKLTFIIFVLAGLGTFLYLRFPVRPTRASYPCVSNLSQIESAKSQWAMEFNKSTNEIPSWEDLKPFIRPSWSNSVPVCPMGGTYDLRPVDQPPTCSIGGIGHSL